VDDEKNIRSSLKLTLSGMGYSVDLAADGREAEGVLTTTPPDVILLDVRLPQRSGIELLGVWVKQYPTIPIILMSGDASVSEALEGLKIGAYDFIEKPILQPRLHNAVHRAFEQVRLRISALDVGEAEHIIGNSLLLKRVLADAEKIAQLKTRVLITGESGTGKDLLARAIHRMSARKDKRFVKINCAAIPSELIESELFGHVKGAFTGAVAARRGLFEVANGGTIFLDEVGELSSSAQAKILRVLQNGELTPVGGNVTITVDVRVIAATNRDLKAEVELGQFREDLYYRLAVVCLQMPALRERPEDIVLLSDYFSSSICKEYGIAPKTLDPSVKQILTGYKWPGNIRELRNVIERLVILAGPVIKKEDLPAEVMAATPHSVATLPCNEGLVFEPKNWEAFKTDAERSFLIFMLKHCQGNISEAARELAVERTTVHKWLKSYQIEKHHYL
jgi:two-component system nitrogen regulation response regulator NtrX